jgi:hypothetical protein
VPRDGGLIAALNTIAALTVDTYREGPAPVSPYVYWWNGVELVLVTTIDGDGTIEDMVNRVCRG